MNIFFQTLRRRALFFAACCLLLALGVAFSSIGVSTYAVAHRQKTLIDAEYTAIAIPYNEKVAGWMPTGWYQKVSPQGGEAGLLEGAPTQVRQDVRVLLGAVVDGMSAANYEAADPLTDGYMMGFDSPYPMSVFAVRCDRVEKDVMDANSYDFTLSVERAICCCDWGYPVPEVLECSTYLVNNDGTPLMEEGKTYLVRGNCTPFTTETLDSPTSFLDLSDGYGDDGLQRALDSNTAYLAEGVFPVCTPYTGDLDAFLTSEAGELWRESIIPTVAQVSSTAKLILTDNVYSVYQFNTGDASILEGRAISEAEYAQGASVCLVSQQYAGKNGLKVGDTLSMDLYKPTIRYASEFMMDDDGELTLPPDQCTLWMNPCYPRDTLDITKQYTIVGIYTGPSIYRFTFPFTPDMIYAPKASVPQAVDFEEEFSEYAFTVSLLLENGALDAFDEYIKEEGCEGWFLYSDQGYSEVAQALEETMTSALRLLVISAAVFLAVICVFFFLLSNAFRPSIRRMRIIGASAGRCWRQAFGAAILLLLLAVAAGTLLGSSLFGAVSSAVLHQTVTNSFSTVLLCALGQLVLLSLVAAVALLASAHKPLLRQAKATKVNV